MDAIPTHWPSISILRAYLGSRCYRMEMKGNTGDYALVVCRRLSRVYKIVMRELADDIGSIMRLRPGIE